MKTILILLNFIILANISAFADTGEVTGLGQHISTDHFVQSLTVELVPTIAKTINQERDLNKLIEKMHIHGTRDDKKLLQQLIVDNGPDETPKLSVRGKIVTISVKDSNLTVKVIDPVTGHFIINGKSFHYGQEKSLKDEILKLTGGSKSKGVQTSGLIELLIPNAHAIAPLLVAGPLVKFMSVGLGVVAVKTASALALGAIVLMDMAVASFKSPGKNYQALKQYLEDSVVLCKSDLEGISSGHGKSTVVSQTMQLIGYAGQHRPSLRYEGHSNLDLNCREMKNNPAVKKSGLFTDYSFTGEICPMIDDLHGCLVSMEEQMSKKNIRINDVSRDTINETHYRHLVEEASKMAPTAQEQ
ncbi:MAG: hypothetical protein HN353_00005 [Bdellovibrionales bacterium]|nr:hypothetical protein [Bdellovibrionales bacterium]MBT3526983.1 hypothetical protein [Bdellovibrionales bacterium]MBT7668745.1 hypothetical protein [Bdellovibrionales bacterium]MBT7765693.1 hypothetical protein [Bdellovibrionales bacterium]